MAFHEVSFPVGVAIRSSGGPERRTIVVQGDSGSETRNSLWANSRRRYDVGTGIKTLQDLYGVLAFFEEHRGRFHGFRFKDIRDWRSNGPEETPAFSDQIIGIGDGVKTDFQLVKTYGATNPWSRTILKPVTGTVLLGIDGAQQMSGWTVDTTTGIVSFSSPPGDTLLVTAGFSFDVPVRFGADELMIDMAAFEAGQAPSIPLFEDPNG